MTGRPRVDTRTRPVGATGPDDPGAFFAGPWRDALARHGARAAADAARLRVAPLVLDVDGDAWTLRAGGAGVEAVPGRHAAATVVLDRAAFADLVVEARTALGLVVGDRAAGDPDACWSFCAWDPVLRSVLDGRAVHAPGEVVVADPSGRPLDLDRRFAVGDPAAGDFLAAAGFVLLTGVFTAGEMDDLDADLATAVAEAAPGDGTSWWATTAAGARYPCRILDLAERSATVRALVADERFLAVGALLGDGHRPGDPFGEHFGGITAEGLQKRVDTVDGLACLPWHKDCDRGGHPMHCSGITVGICLTPVDEDHGGLDVVAGSHRANLARSQVDAGPDLPRVTLAADRGDVTVHLSCTVHRSTPPARAERRVVYTGFTLPPRADDARSRPAARLRRERAAIGTPDRVTRLGATDDPPDPR